MRTDDRWWQARQAFGAVNSSASQIAHLAAIWCADHDHVRRIMAWLNVFQFTVLMVCAFVCVLCVLCVLCVTTAESPPPPPPRACPPNPAHTHKSCIANNRGAARSMPLHQQKLTHNTTRTRRSKCWR